MYNDSMEVDAVRIACPACGSRLTVMPRIQYLVCKHCGSEYLVQRRGNTIGLETFAEEQFELSKQIAAVEQTQTEGCSNVFFWIFAVAVIFFCLLGYLGRTFLNSSIPLVVGWALSLLALVVAAGVLVKMLNFQRGERLKLEARKQELYERQADDVEQSE
jgi:DNA-directed RNA polymerase subunit RPC12/RpoP